jgi:hypothetical protein
MDDVVSDDPILVRREQIARLAALGKRVGYAALAVAVVAFFIAVFAGFPSWAVTTSIVGLVAACIILPVPIVLAYGVQKAAREDPEQPRTK